MTVNLCWLVALFDDFKDRTPWYVKVLFGLILGVILTSGILYAFFTPASQPAVAAGPTTALPTSQPTSTWAPKPTQTPPPTVASPTPMPTSVPVVNLVWADQASAVNLRDAPSGNVIKAVDNGSVVTLLEDVEESGGYIWIKVEVDGQKGWMADFLIWEVEGVYHLLEEARDYYQSSDGAQVGMLPKGTPYKTISEEEGWVQILLPDEQVVWIEK